MKIQKRKNQFYLRDLKTGHWILFNGKWQSDRDIFVGN